MSEITEFCTLSIYILKHTSKKRGSIGKEEKRRDLRDIKRIAQSEDLKRHSDKIQICRTEGALQSQCEKTTFCSRRICPHIYNAFSLMHNPDPESWVGGRGCGVGAGLAGWQPEHTSNEQEFTHLPLAISSAQEALHMKANEVLADSSSAEVTADERLVSRNSEEQLDRNAMAWQEPKELSMLPASIPEKQNRARWRGSAVFAYNLRREDSLKEDWRYQRKVVQKWWQLQCAFCCALSHHLLRSCSPRAVPCSCGPTKHLLCWHRGLQVFATIAHHIIVGRETAAWTHVLSWKQGKLVVEKEG